MNYEDFDYILEIDSSLEDVTNEAKDDGFRPGVDPRTFARKLPSGYDYSPTGIYPSIRDPKLMTSWSFGKQLQRDLNGLGAGYSCQVFDCGGEVAVTVTHCQTETGRSASKSFIIVFDKKGDGIIKSSNTRWRSISGLSQAVSYIKSVASNLTSLTQTPA